MGCFLVDPSEQVNQIDDDSYKERWLELKVSFGKVEGVEVEGVVDWLEGITDDCF